MLFLAAACWAIGPRQASALSYHPAYGNYTVEVVSGPIDGVGFNGSRADFNDSGNVLTAELGGAAQTLSRTYVLTFTADPGWAFSTITMGAFGQGYAGWATWRAGLMSYQIATDPLSPAVASGDLTFYYGLAAEWDPTNRYAQNPSWDYFSEFGFTSGAVSVPASSFTLTFDTDLYLATYQGMPDANTYIGLGGNSVAPSSFNVFAETISAPQPEASPVPEPSTYALLLSGVAALVVLRRKSGKRD